MTNLGYDMSPRVVPLVKTKYREICTQIPVPESMELLKRLYDVESYSLHWQFPIFWDKAENFSVFDRYGNKWLDLSGGIAVANTGHGRKEIIEEIIKQAQHGLLYNFTFPSEIRMKFLEKLIEFTPSYLNKAFLMCAGSEACENLLKISRGYAHQKYGKQKNIIITFDGAFHGRTLGAQMMGGLPDLKSWIVNPDPDIYQVPFPDGYYNEDTSFELFEKSIKELGIDPNNIAMVLAEPVQGANVHYFPKEYVKKLADWCKKYNILLGFDEVQTGFGRTGKDFGFMNYDVEADLISLGKGISSSLPISASVARKEIIDSFPPGGMTSTHTGNPISCAVALRNLELYREEHLIENSEKLGFVLNELVQDIVKKYDIVGIGNVIGLFAGLQIVEPGTKKPMKQWAYEINQRIIEKGVMVFAPVGKATVKLAPPLTITEEALREGLSVIDEAIGEIIKEKNLS